MSVSDPSQQVIEALAGGVSEKQIRKELEEYQSIPDGVARRLIADAKKNPEVMARRESSLRGIRAHQKRNWLLTMASGAGLLAVGIVVTIIGIALSSPGGMYAAGGGAILGGLALLGKGLYHRIRG